MKTLEKTKHLNILNQKELASIYENLKKEKWTFLPSSQALHAEIKFLSRGKEILLERKTRDKTKCPEPPKHHY